MVWPIPILFAALKGSLFICVCTVRFVSDLVRNPEDLFSRVAAQKFRDTCTWKCTLYGVHIFLHVYEEIIRNPLFEDSLGALGAGACSLNICFLD